MIDTTRTIEVAGSPMKLLLLVGAGVVMTALSLAVAVPLLPDLEPGIVLKSIGYFGVAFFAFCTLVAIARLARGSAQVLTISPQGIRDTRVAAGMVQWPEVRGISTWEFNRQKVMVVKVDPATESRIGLTAIARWSRSANTALGADGLAITASGVKIDYDTLLATSIAYARAHGGMA